MARIAAFITFGCLVLLVYMAVQSIFPQWVDWNYLYGVMADRIDSEQTAAVGVLFIYLLLASWVLLAFGRWMAGFAKSIISSIYGLFGGKKEDAVHQTLDNTLIIDSPQLKRPMVRFLETILSAAVWLIFIYLFQAIVTTLMWIFGLERIYSSNISHEAIQGTIDATLFAFYAALIFITILFAWAKWNYWRFGRLDRRQEMPAVKADEVAEFFVVPLATILQIQSDKVTAIMPTPTGLVFREIKLEN